MLVPLVALTQTAPPAQPFQRLAGCVYKPQRWNDGDSFHVVLRDQKEVVVRLYFVDTPEEERVYADRCQKNFRKKLYVSESRLGPSFFSRAEIIIEYAAAAPCRAFRAVPAIVSIVRTRVALICSFGCLRKLSFKFADSGLQ